MSWSYTVRFEDGKKLVFDKLSNDIVEEDHAEVKSVIDLGIRLTKHKTFYPEDDVKKDFIKVTQEEYDTCIREQYAGEFEKEFLERYSQDEMIFFKNFWEIAMTVDYNLSKNFYLLYGIIRGPIPNSCPGMVSYADTLERLSTLTLRNRGKQILNKYVLEHPNALKDIRNTKVPEDFPFNKDLEITSNKLTRYLPEEIERRRRK